MYFHRRQTCTKRLSTPKFVTCNLKSELKFFQPYTTQTNMKVRTLKSRNKHWLYPIFWMNLRLIIIFNIYPTLLSVKPKLMYQTDVVVHSVGKVWSTILRKNDAIGHMHSNNRQDVAINQKNYFIYNREKIVYYTSRNSNFIYFNF